jgi:hypothetical protein
MIWDLKVSLNLPECEVSILIFHVVCCNILGLGIAKNKEAR